jgi:hypothetical protein
MDRQAKSIDPRRGVVIDSQKDFARRRYLTEAGRNFDKLRTQVLNKHGVDIECCRATYCEAGQKLFALVGDLLVNAYANPPIIERKQAV